MCCCQFGDGSITAGLERVAGALPRKLPLGQWSERDDGTVRQDDLLLDDVVDRLSVDHGPGAARVVRHHPAECGAAGGRDVGRETKAVRAKLRVQLVEHDARLHARPSFLHVQFEDGVEVLRRVDDEPGADGLAGLRRAAAPHRDRAVQARTDLNEPLEIVARSRERNADRLDLIDARVRRVESLGDRVESKLAGERGFQFPLKF